MTIQTMALLDTLNILALCIVSTIISLDMNLTRSRKVSLISLFVLLIIIMLTEIISNFVDGVEGLRAVNVLTNYIGFMLPPLVPILCGAVLKKFKNTFIPIAIYMIYFVILTLSIFFDIIFYVDENNIYHRAKFFWIYILFYVFGLFYWLTITYLSSNKIQNRSKSIIVLLALFIFAGTTVQVLNRYIYLTWTCISLAVIIYYLYCSQLWQQVDGLTNLLNNNCYLKEVKRKKHKLLLIVDVDNFKNVNDKHSHMYGNQCLQDISRSLIMSYSKYGLCFRIGGDEFAVIVYKQINNITLMNAVFLDKIEKLRHVKPDFPSVSIGYAVHNIGDDYTETMNKADRMMYNEKIKKSVDDRYLSDHILDNVLNDDATVN